MPPGALYGRSLSAARQSVALSREQAVMRWESAKLGFRAARGPVSIFLVANAVAAVLLVGYVYFSGELLAAIPAAVRDGWSSAAGGTVKDYLIAIGVCFLGSQMLTPVNTRLADLVIREVDGAVRDRVAATAVRVPGLAAFEDQALLRELAIAKDGLDEGQRSPGQAVAGLTVLSGLYLQTYLAAVLIAVLLNPLVAVGLLIGGLLIRRSHRIGLVLESRGRLRNWDLEREAGYYRKVALDGAAGREVRVFGLGGWLRGRYRAISVSALDSSMAIRHKVHGSRFIPPVVAATIAGVLSILWVAGHAGHIAIPGLPAPSDAIPLRNLVIALQAGYIVLQIGNYFQEDWQTQWGLTAQRALDEFDRGSAAKADGDPLARWQGDRDPAGLPHQALRFEGVTFRYPGAARDVLDDLALDIQAGRSLAIVGLNGAGKTTLVKLLAGLYQPTAGRISVDGTDLRGLDLPRWQRNVAAIYQDFERYQLTAAQNIAFADAGVAGKREDIRWAAAQAGILATLEALPNGLDSPLATGYDGGTDLSGGQWQRVALARAFYALRTGAGVLVLDEPTASLDVRSEAAFLDRFIELTRGVTTVVISHRFATVRHADQIVVLDGGRITERGSHQELLASDGRYAELFRLQAQRFADSADAPEPATDVAAQEAAS